MLCDVLHVKKHDPKVTHKNFDNKTDAHILLKYNEKTLNRIHHWKPEISEKMIVFCNFLKIKAETKKWSW